MKDPESFPENNKGNQENALLWNPGVDHLEKSVVLSRE